MSRSTGSFPHYTKIDVDPNEFPKDYWNASQVCPNCETRWPSSHLFSITPCCGEKATVDTHAAPDMRWPDAIKSLLTVRFENFYEKYNEGKSDDQLEESQITKVADPVATH